MLIGFIELGMLPTGTTSGCTVSIWQLLRGQFCRMEQLFAKWHVIGACLRIAAAEPGIHEALLQSKHRTLDPEEADFFYIPVYAACYIHPIHGTKYLVRLPHTWFQSLVIEIKFEHKVQVSMMLPTFIHSTVKIKYLAKLCLNWR